jgi:SSS family solute:Na+ symporter
LLTRPEDEAVLTEFYRTVRPWGWWAPIRDRVMRADPSFQPNPNFRKDCVNVVVGIVWQVSLAALPIYLVLRDWLWVGSIFTTLLITSIIIKVNWYDKLEQDERVRVSGARRVLGGPAEPV